MWNQTDYIGAAIVFGATLVLMRVIDVIWAAVEDSRLIDPRADVHWLDPNFDDRGANDVEP